MPLRLLAGWNEQGLGWTSLILSSGELAFQSSWQTMGTTTAMRAAGTHVAEDGDGLAEHIDRLRVWWEGSPSSNP